MSEALLHFAARVDHVEKVIKPALEKGTWVISDRFADSTFAYQGAGQGLGRDSIEALHTLCLGDFAPDLTLILDMPVAAALERAQRRGGEDRYERMGQAFHERLRQAFLDIAAANPVRCRVVDARGTPETVAEQLWAATSAKFGLP
jgi:dTMP kinase